MNLKKLSVFSKIILFFNILLLVSLLLSYIGGYVKPSSAWPLTFFALAFPPLFLLNFPFIIYWIFRWRILFVFSLAGVIPGFFYLPGFFQFNLIKNELPENGIKLLSYNVRLFDLYNWTSNKKTKNKIFDFLKDEDADIVCFQEFYQDDSGRFETLDSLVEFQKANNVHVEYTKTLHEIHHWGIATFSRYPITGKGKILFGEKNNNVCIFTDLLINKDTVRVYNVHLQSAHLNPQHYKFFEEINNDSEKENLNILKGYKKIIQKIKNATIKRTQQVDSIYAHILESPHPVILCGDFNDPPSSYVYNKIMNSKLKDSFIESGNGLGRTYNGKFPSMRIDYIFHDPRFNSFGFETLPEDFSDHFPLVVWLHPDSAD